MYVSPSYVNMILMNMTFAMVGILILHYINIERLDIIKMGANASYIKAYTYVGTASFSS